MAMPLWLRDKLYTRRAVRRVAKQRGLTLIDQRACMPDGKRYYNDPCHLTDDGCARWVENVMNELDLSKIGRH